MGVPPEKVHTDRLYEGLDRLLPHKEALETHLRQRLGELFALKCEGNPLAQRGYSRDSRPDRPQV